MKTEIYRTMKIPEKIQNLIEEIPENGAVEVDSWQTYEETDPTMTYIIGKISGRLEFFITPKSDPENWRSIYQWNYAEEPEEWEEHFDIAVLPQVQKKLYGVFI